MIAKPEPRPAAFTPLPHTNIGGAGNILTPCDPTTVKRSEDPTVMTDEPLPKLLDELNEVLAA